MANIKLVKKNAKEWVVTNNGENVGIANKNTRGLYTYSAIVAGGKLVHGDTQKELKENIASYLESLVIEEEQVVAETITVETTEVTNEIAKNVVKVKELTLKSDNPLYTVTQRNLASILGDNQTLEISKYAYELRTSDDSENVGYLFKVERPPLTKRKHRGLHSGIVAGLWQTHGWLFIGNLIGPHIFETKMKDVVAKVNEEYAKLV